nr:APC family permease [Pectinatus frisingensis]
MEDFAVFSRIRRLLIGRPLKNEEALYQRLPKWKALAIFSSDALSSVSYGPEQIAVVLALSGMVTYGYYLYSLIPIVILLAVVTISYTQVARANPGGGGSYSVARENLGEGPALVAGAALFTDYVLTVAVSITSGTAALTSAFPFLGDYKIALDLFVLFGVLTIINLRGVSESAKFFVLPTYLFVGSMLAIILVGVVQALTGTAPVVPEVSMQRQPMNMMIFFLILRAFANGCSSMTGLEAIANGVPMFKEPAYKNAIHTTYYMSGLLATMMVGISFLVLHYHVMPNPDITMLSQIAEMTVGRGYFYYFFQLATMLILFLAANTAYNGLPPLMSIIAKDGYLPRYLGQRGERLNFSNGIILLSLATAVLLIAFNGNTEHLISLYAIGVFLSFTIAQSGMVVYWSRNKIQHWHWRAAINAFGAVITGIVVVIIAVTKFFYGAWIVLIFIPATIYCFKKINSHYTEMGKELALKPGEKFRYISSPIAKNYVILPISYPTRSVIEAMRYARKIGDEVIAVHIAADEQNAEYVKKVWHIQDPEIGIVTIKSPYRMVIQPLLDFIKKVLVDKNPEDYVTVLIPEVQTNKWWHRLLHNQTGLILRTLLIHKENVIVVTVPFRLKM